MSKNIFCSNVSNLIFCFYSKTKNVAKTAKTKFDIAFYGEIGAERPCNGMAPRRSHKFITGRY